MTKKGTSIIFINDKREILLFLRDDISSIPYPNMWDLPGGHVEKGESPEQCIIREINEEMGIHLENFHFFMEKQFSDRTEYVFWKKENLNIQDIVLTEGQYLKWFTEKEVMNTELACCFNQVVEIFFHNAPYIEDAK